MTLLTYRQFPEREQAENLAAILQESGIPFKIVEDTDNFDSIYGDKQFRQMYQVKIRNTDFEKADEILLEKNQQPLGDVEPDHYLFSFTDEELYEILAKRDEWNEFDFLLAQKILRDRGHEVTDALVSTLRNKRIQDLAKPDQDHGPWIFVGYFSACLGGLLGILIGWHLRTFKKTLPDGQRVYAYTARVRKHGSTMFTIGLVMFAICASFGLGLWMYDLIWIF